MELKPGYKMTEVGVIPEDWKDAPLGGLAEIRMCKRIFSEQTNSSGDIPFFKIGTFGRAPDAFISGDLYREYKRKYSFPKKGDVLLSAAGTLGRTVVYDGGDAYFQDSNIVWLDIDHGKITNEYLYQCYQTIRWASPEGSTISRLYNGIIRKTKIPLPPTETEQTAIATALSDVDELLATLDQVIAKKRDLKQAAMQQLLTGKTRLPGFTGEWLVRRLGEVLFFQVGFPFSSAFFNEKERGLRLVKNRDLKCDDQIVYYAGKYDDTFLVANGDVLVGMDGDFVPCRWAKGRALLNQRVGRVVPRSGLDRNFAYYFLIEPLKEIEAATSSTTVKHLSHGDVESIEKPMPHIDEQTAIAAALSEMDAELSVLESRRDKTRNIKQAMMQELLTGKTRLVEPGGANA